MNIIFKSTLVALLLSTSFSTNTNAADTKLPLLSDVVDNMDMYIRYTYLYSKRDKKKYALVKLKLREVFDVPKKTYAEVGFVPLSPKYHNAFPWIGNYQTYAVQRKGSTICYYLTIAEILKIKKKRKSIN